MNLVVQVKSESEDKQISCLSATYKNFAIYSYKHADFLPLHVLFKAQHAQFEVEAQN